MMIIFQGFSSKLKYESVWLWCAADIVQHSYVVQNSISHLHLEVCQSYAFRTRGPYLSTFFYNGVIDTEEKCRKIHASSRSLLYNLHLDLPKGRERSLKCYSKSENLRLDDSPYLDKIFIKGDFYLQTLCSFILSACANTDHYIKVLKWFLKLDDIEPKLAPLGVLNHVVDTILPGITDAEFARECVEKFNFMFWLNFNKTPGRVENLLYQICRMSGRTECDFWNCDFPDHCLLHHSFQYVGYVLKFLDAPHFCGLFDKLVLENILKWRFLLSKDFQKALKTRIGKRHSLLLHLYWSYSRRHKYPSAAFESLRLIWNSIRDAFISLEEFISLFNGIIRHEEIVNICKFYSKAVGKLYPSMQPRSLKHFCRTSIRGELCKSLQWLPEGIGQLGLPPKLQSYLKLEEITW